MPSLDINTCGGELLASLQPLPATVATEGWAPSLPIARDRRGAFGFDVRRHGGTGSRCELGDGECDPVLNRHGRLDARELARVLAPGGVPVTQRIGSRNDAEVNDVLGASPVEVPGANSRDGAWLALEERDSRSSRRSRSDPRIFGHDHRYLIRAERQGR
jgi:hypothetical protein